MLPKSIPDKLSGTVQPQWVRCGNPECRCARGELHGPYFYRFWRDENGRQHKEYVRKSDLAAVWSACAAWHAQQQETRKLLGKGPEVVRWRAGKQVQCEDPLQELERLVERITTIRMLGLLACGDFGSTRQQVRAAILVSQIRDAGRSLRYSGVQSKLLGGQPASNLLRPVASAEVPPIQIPQSPDNDPRSRPREECFA